MKKLSILSGLLFAVLLFSCKNDTNNTSQPTTTIAEKVVLDSFADAQILQYELPGWDKLSLKQKTFIYYLSEAALYGRDIAYDQHCKYNVPVRKTLEAVLTTYKGDKTSDNWKALEEYTKRVWFSNGIHHHYSETKIMPAFTEAYFAEVVSQSDATALPLEEGQDAASLVAALTPVIFSPTLYAKRTNKEEGVDVVQTSAVNFYEGVTADQVDAFYKSMKKAYGPKAPSFGLNSKLISKDGQLTELVWSAKPGAMYSEPLQKIVENLQKAVPFAENEQQQKAMGLLIEYFQTGDLTKFDAYNIEWLKDTESTVDFINGFIESYHDPKGYKADYEAAVQYNDPDATEKMAVVSAHAQYFEDNSPIMDTHKKDTVKGVSYRVINVAMESGGCAPTTPIGINLPNSDWIREDYGSKSISLNNIENAYNKASGGAAVKEFANDPEEVERSLKYSEACGKMHTALHEVIGHASGKLNPGVSEPNISLKQYSSTLEEGRADLVALYYMPDPELIKWGLMPDADAFKAEYDSYIRNGLLQQYRRIQAGSNLEEDHMRNRQLVAAWAFEKGANDGVIVRENRNGKTYYDIRDYTKLREIFGQLLREIQRIKSEGDYTAAKALVEGYGVKVPAERVTEVKDRYKALGGKPYSGFVQPKLVAIRDANGNINDVKVEKELDFTQQMLRYGKEYSF